MKQLMYDPLNIVICGIGGQGNVLAAELVASAMNDLEYRVAEGETYGAAQRGGSVMSHVRVSADTDLGVLIPAGDAHFIIGFEPLETLRIARRYANPGTLIIYDPRPIYPQSVLRGKTVYPDLNALKAEIASLCKKAIEAMPAAVADFKNGKEKALMAVLGNVMKQSRGRADAPSVIKKLKELIG